jgi:hypothetical protein
MILKRLFLPLFAFITILATTLFATNSIAQQAVNTLTNREIKDEIKDDIKDEIKGVNKSENAFFSTQEPPWIVLGGIARHSCRTCKFRERNPGLALQWKSPWFEEFSGLQDTRLTAGAYINSNNRDSVYAGAQWLPFIYGPVKLGLQAVLITGYKEAAITPVLLPIVSVESKYAGVDMYAVPKMAKVSAAVFATFKVRF